MGGGPAWKHVRRMPLVEEGLNFFCVCDYVPSLEQCVRSTLHAYFWGHFSPHPIKRIKLPTHFCKAAIAEAPALCATSCRGTSMCILFRSIIRFNGLRQCGISDDNVQPWSALVRNIILHVLTRRAWIQGFEKLIFCGWMSGSVFGFLTWKPVRIVETLDVYSHCVTSLWTRFS